MIHIWQNILDSIAPPTEAGAIVRSYTPDTFINFYQPQVVGNVTALATYHTPAIHAAVASCKFEHNTPAATLLASLLAHHLQTLPPKPTILTGIPLSKERERTRGHNQVLSVIRSLPKGTESYHIAPTLLVRTRHTAPQTDLGRAERLTNVVGAFAVDSATLIKIPATCKRIIICDDVVTTGATMQSAVATLRAGLPSQIEIIAIAWAH